MLARVSSRACFMGMLAPGTDTPYPHIVRACNTSNLICRLSA